MLIIDHQTVQYLNMLPDMTADVADESLIPPLARKP